MKTKELKLIKEFTYRDMIDFVEWAELFYVRVGSGWVQRHSNVSKQIDLLSSSELFDLWNKLKQQYKNGNK